MRNYVISNRLMSAVGFVRGGTFADVGTDHGYLPIYLYEKRLIKKAVASDINPMPLESARRNILDHGAQDGIVTVLSDGLEKIQEFLPDDIAIFGMGGELICRIIGNATWTKDPGIRLILQPMTKQEETREYLLSQGFSIVDEALSYDDGKIYQTICAEYRGVSESYSAVELILGRHNIKRGGELFKKLVKNRMEVYSSRLEGKRLAGLGAEEAELLEKFKDILESVK